MTNETCDQALQLMKMCHSVFAAEVAPPKAVAVGDGHVFRYQERVVHQALVQKLARITSGLHAAKLLSDHGFIQEQGAIQRMLDEFNEDILFLACSVIFGDASEDHQIYLEAFFQEEFDNPESAMKSTQKRPMVPRQKIRAYLARIDGTSLDPSTAAEAMRTVDKLYSGFVHGASPQIMEMYFGNPPHFHVAGMLGTQLAGEYREDLWNCFYRSIIAFANAAKAFGQDALNEKLRDYLKVFAQANGENLANRPSKG